MNKINKSFFKKKSVIVTIIIVVLALILFFLLKPKAPKLETLTVKKSDIIHEVSATGNVTPAQTVDLAFEKSTRITNVSVDVGSRVQTGQILATIDNSDVLSQLNQAKATLENQQAKLEQLKKGTRPEQIKLKESQLAKAQQDLANYYNGILDVLNDAYSKSNDAVRNQTAGIFTNGESNSPQLTINSNDQQASVDVVTLRVSASNELNVWHNELQTSDFSDASLDRLISSSKNHLAAIRPFLNRTMDVLNSAMGISPTTVAAYKTSVNLGITNVNSASISVNNQSQAIASQKSLIINAQNDLDLSKAGSTPEEISSQEALVKQAQANVENYQAQLEKTNLRSPFNGIVSKINAKVGEISSPSLVAFSLISDSYFEIDANIPEADIASVKVGDLAKVTLDAYGNSVIFDAKVVSVDPAETIVEGVSTYKTTLQFIKESDQIKSGMTANIDIKTDEKKDILSLPQRVIKSDTSEKTVEILNPDGKTTHSAKVQTGLRGSDGSVEITSGLKEGDIIIIPNI